MLKNQFSCLSILRRGHPNLFLFTFQQNYEKIFRRCLRSRIRKNENNKNDQRITDDGSVRHEIIPQQDERTENSKNSATSLHELNKIELKQANEDVEDKSKEVLVIRELDSTQVAIICDQLKTSTYSNLLFRQSLAVQISKRAEEFDLNSLISSLHSLLGFERRESGWAAHQIIREYQGTVWGRVLKLDGLIHYFIEMIPKVDTLQVVKIFDISVQLGIHTADYMNILTPDIQRRFPQSEIAAKSQQTTRSPIDVRSLISLLRICNQGRLIGQRNPLLDTRNLLVLQQHLCDKLSANICRISKWDPQHLTWSAFVAVSDELSVWRTPQKSISDALKLQLKDEYRRIAASKCEIPFVIAKAGMYLGEHEPELVRTIWSKILDTIETEGVNNLQHIIQFVLDCCGMTTSIRKNATSDQEIEQKRDDEVDHTSLFTKSSTKLTIELNEILKCIESSIGIKNENYLYLLFEIANNLSMLSQRTIRYNSLASQCHPYRVPKTFLQKLSLLCHHEFQSRLKNMTTSKNLRDDQFVFCLSQCASLYPHLFPHLKRLGLESLDGMLSHRFSRLLDLIQTTEEAIHLLLAILGLFKHTGQTAHRSESIDPYIQKLAKIFQQKEINSQSFPKLMECLSLLGHLKLRRELHLVCLFCDHILSTRKFDIVSFFSWIQFLSNALQTIGIDQHSTTLIIKTLKIFTDLFQPNSNEYLQLQITHDKDNEFFLDISELAANHIFNIMKICAHLIEELAPSDPNLSIIVGYLTKVDAQIPPLSAPVMRLSRQFNFKLLTNRFLHSLPFKSKFINLLKDIQSVEEGRMTNNKTLGFTTAYKIMAANRRQQQQDYEQ